MARRQCRADARDNPRCAVRLRLVGLCTAVAVAAVGCGSPAAGQRGASRRSSPAPTSSAITRTPAPEREAGKPALDLELVPGSAIGKAKIGDTLHQATAALGAGKRMGRDSRVYRQDGVKIGVNFVAGRVFSIGTDSAPLLLDGTPLSMGYPYFSNHTKWSHATCQGNNELFHFTKHTHAETTITWGPNGRLTNVMIQTVSTPTGSGCAVSSQAQPAAFAGPVNVVGRGDR
jgi:hypothetical protein